MTMSQSRLNAEQINQVDISRPSPARALTLLVKAGLGLARLRAGDRRAPANPEPENWLMTRGNYKGWSYSALDQINAHNVKNPCRSECLDRGTPVANRYDRQQRAVHHDAVQSRTRQCGQRRLLWRYKRAAGRLQCLAQHQSRRGLYGDKVTSPARRQLVASMPRPARPRGSQD
jgi:hypothetical protein